METQAEYKTGSPALFHATATEYRIWTYCPNCWDRTEHLFKYEDETKEYYECQCCQKLHGIAVR